ncbi:hypothetical protein HY486_03590 [Candidatus Woesearchaeota archaeon]|nr:hypothetical protein [Candidatus Woesearchaeota archaeon]
MKLEITSQKEQTLLSRKQVGARIIYDKATPSKDTIKQEIAGQLKAEPALIALGKIETIFGTTEAKVTAYVYENKEKMALIEIKPSVEKGSKKTEKKQEVKKEA